MTILAAGRPFWPLFLHVLGAMTLFGATLSATVLAAAAWRRPAPALARGTFLSLLVVALPAWVVLRIGAGFLASDEGYDKGTDPGWLNLGAIIGDAGLILLLVITAGAFWWSRGGRALIGRIVAGLSGVYLALLCVAWLAMSTKW